MKIYLTLTLAVFIFMTAPSAISPLPAAVIVGGLAGSMDGNSTDGDCGLTPAVQCDPGAESLA